MTTDHTNDQPPEPPPLPDGWKSESYDDGYDTYERYAFSKPPMCHDVTVWSHPLHRVEIRGPVSATELHAVLAHHLGLTAPVADVRALALKVLDPYVESVGLHNLAAPVQSAYLVLKGAGS